MDNWMIEYKELILKGEKERQENWFSQRYQMTKLYTNTSEE